MKKKKLFIIFLILLILTTFMIVLRELIDRITSIELNNSIVSSSSELTSQPAVQYIHTASAPDSTISSRISELENVNEITLVATQPLDMGTVVGITNGTAFLFDITNENLYDFAIGVTKSSAGAGEYVKVILTGKVAGFSNLVPNQNYYVGTSGQITNVVPQQGILRSVGIALSANELLTDFSQKIIL